MKVSELLTEERRTTPEEFMKLMGDFLPMAMKHLKIDSLPDFKLVARVPDDEQPTFGKFVPHENRIYLALEQRHPLDVLRTMAHELTHFKQGTEHKLGPTSGHTGSPTENEAHETAGIIMRHFNKAHPEYFQDQAITLSEDWNKVNRHDKTNGLSQKAVNAYRREHPGSKLKTAVTTKPSKLKKGSKAAKRRKSFCARMSGNKGPMKKPNGKPTPKALALRRWHCESIEEMAQLIETAERVIAEKWTQKYKSSINCSHPKGFSQKAHCAGKKKHNESFEMESVCPDCGMCETHGNNMMEVKQRLDAKCWKGKHKEGTKMKGGIRVNNCVPNESIKEAGSPAQQAAIAINMKKNHKKPKNASR